jgi:Nickel responsive protein SCO4226-like
VAGIEQRGPGGRTLRRPLPGRTRLPVAKEMPKYVMERDLPGAGDLTADELHFISQKSNKVICEPGPEICWLTSYVTDDKIYCV